MSETTKYTDEQIKIRPAKKEDMKAVAEMIQELADFEEMSDGPKLSVRELEHDGFEQNPPAFQCKVAAEVVGGALLGYALYFPSYSTWRGRALLLEDLYVRSSARRRGVGRMLFDAVAKEAAETGCCRVDFHVLEWNPARAFYERAGAEDLTRAERWCLYRLGHNALARHVTEPTVPAVPDE